MEKTEEFPPRSAWWFALAFLMLSLTLRLLFWQATPDRTSAYTAYYKGDAPYWLAYARSVQTSTPFELGLPLRPPGIPYLLALLWDGEGSNFTTLRFFWCLAGALTVALMFLAAWRSFGPGPALVAGVVMSASTGLILLSTSLNNETPYLFLIACCLILWTRFSEHPGFVLQLSWGAINGLACLIRVEHVLFFGLTLAWFLWTWSRPAKRGQGWKLSLRGCAWICLAFVLVLAPWHLKAWSDIRDFNNEPLSMNPATEQAVRQIESSMSHLNWQEGALKERERLPAFARRTAANFVAATVAARGGTEVSAADFRILEEAFGYRPEPVETHPFMVLYGGLNFYLANHEGAGGGFSLGPLEKPPPLAGGMARYPPSLITGLPPQHLTLTYPPHLQALNHGYRLGLEWIRQQPMEFLGLIWRKLKIFWEGASLGWTGYNFPMGLSGTRRPVDLVIPEGSLTSTLWRSLLLALLCTGLYFGLGQAELIPWLLFLLTKVVATVVFFGYAREGATLVPVFAVLLGLVVGRWLPPGEGSSQLGREIRNRWLLGALCAGLLLIAVEGVRWMSGPEVTLDGRKVGSTDPFSVVDYEPRRLLVK